MARMFILFRLSLRVTGLAVGDMAIWGKGLISGPILRIVNVVRIVWICSTYLTMRVFLRKIWITVFQSVALKTRNEAKALQK